MAHAPATPPTSQHDPRAVTPRDCRRLPSWVPVLLCAAVLGGASTADAFTSAAQPSSLRRRTRERSSLSTVTSSLTVPPIPGMPAENTPRDGKAGLPTTVLPRLTPEDLRALNVGLPVQRQTRDGWLGSGMVAMDVKADPEQVWELLQDFANYDTLIDTVRKSQVRQYQMNGDPNETQATFVLSKFRFEVNVIHKFDWERQQLSFRLDKSSRNVILKKAEGTWHVQSEAEGLRPGHTRVWLCSSIHVSRVVPRWIVDYAARRALPRATTWLRPTVEGKAAEARAAAAARQKRAAVTANTA